MFRIVTLILLASAVELSCYAKLPNEIKQQLKQRYLWKNMVIVHSSIRVVRDEALGKIDYDYFHSPLVMPNRFQGRNRIDEFTAESISSSATLTDPVQVGEQVRVWDLEAKNAAYSWQRRELGGEDAAIIEMRIVALAGGRERLAREDLPLPGSEKPNFVAHFRFLFPPPASASADDYFRTIVGAIDRFFIPRDEYYAKEKARRQSQSDRQNISINPRHVEGRCGPAARRA